MSKYQEFIFEDFTFDEAAKCLTLRYSFDGEQLFSETYRFMFEFTPNLHPEALERACKLLFFMAGVSYYKAYLPLSIKTNRYSLSKAEADFYSKTYQKGLGEFFYVNQLDPNTRIEFPHVDEILNTLSIESGGLLIGIGGGKDSLVTAELLGNQSGASTWSVDHEEQLAPLINKIGLPHFSVERTLDPSLLDLNNQGALNGHVPISAILACVGAVVAVLSGKRDIVVSNESSASEPNLHYKGVAINHQYSKSLEFEKDFQAILRANFGETIRYYSALRPLTELRIAELFSESGLEKYKDVFSSCNKAFTHTSHELFWCGKCPKCAFVFLALTPFVERQKLETLFHGKNLLLDPSLEQTYQELLGIKGDKPLECVGEIKESRAAMRLAQKQYPELAKYQFELPGAYNFRELSSHLIPDEVANLLLPKFERHE